MKKLLLTTTILLVAGAANAADIRPYISLKLGHVNSNIKIKMHPGMPPMIFNGSSGFTAAVAGGVGYDVISMISLRGELEYTYSRTEKIFVDRNFDIERNALMLNGYIDLGKWAVKPYVGAGIGYGFGTFVNQQMGFRSGLAHAGMVGIAYSVNKQWALDLSVKYMRMKSRIGGVNYNTDFRDRSILLGVRYTF